MKKNTLIIRYSAKQLSRFNQWKLPKSVHHLVHLILELLFESINLDNVVAGKTCPIIYFDSDMLDQFGFKNFSLVNLLETASTGFDMVITVFPPKNGKLRFECGVQLGAPPGNVVLEVLSSESATSIINIKDSKHELIPLTDKQNDGD